MGNKSDLFDEEKVSEEEAENYAKKIDAIFKFTSAASGDGIESLFNTIGCKILNPNYDPSGEEEGEKKDDKNTNKDKDDDELSKPIRLDSNRLIKKNKFHCCYSK